MREEFDFWLYPEDLGFDKVINLFREEDGEVQINEYELPDDWREICVPNGNESILDVMIDVTE